jgi:hypothetical protein
MPGTILKKFTQSYARLPVIIDFLERQSDGTCLASSFCVGIWKGIFELHFRIRFIPLTQIPSLLFP